MLMLAVVSVSIVVAEYRQQVAAWIRRAIGRGDVTEKAVAIDLGRDLGQLSRMIATGTIQLADVLAMPAPVRQLVIEAVAGQAGLITVRQYLRDEAEARERACLEAIHGRAVRCEIKPRRSEVA